MDQDQEHGIRMDILMGLRAGLRLCDGMRRKLSEREQHLIVDQVMVQFRLSKVEFVPKVPYAPWPVATTSEVEGGE